MSSQRQIPGGAFYNDSSTTGQRQVPGGAFVNEVVSGTVTPPTLLTAYADQITTTSERPNVTFTRP